MPATEPVFTWQGNPLDLGPLYPLAGWEKWMFGVSLAVFVAFLAWKLVAEHAKYDHQAKQIVERRK